MTGSRCIPNNFPEPLTPGDTGAHLKQALEDIVQNYPPLGQYDRHSLQGLWSGPTGIAYLLLHVSAAHPKLIISGHHALTWAKSYLDGSRGSLKLSSRGCGIGEESLCYHAVAAAIRQDHAHVRELVSCITSVVQGDYPDELLFGRAGTLYLLRMVRRWVPDSSPLVDDAVARVTQKMIQDGPHWKWHGKRYVGAVHGDIGILAQLVLTAPSVAPELEGLLDALLDAQLPDGNWPSSEGHTTASLVQFCHGAPGFVHSLLSLREYFPSLQRKIDAAVQRGRECIWTSGLLRKEPSLCHGIFGNALALPPGQQREHFLAVATPERMSQLRKQDETLFEPADYGKPYSLTTGYAPCATWSWLVCGEEVPKVIAFNDV
ncbi:LanC-like protein 2 [Coniochaeta hoffmannii]|uniref:LanC-like protein 2 n=1 Tax=Coniochaeta hoffmannii TaxID=91930 RepID=A0AA38RWX9_9PEZI|nr:LanC-like protein 2 [Coniochaeta hoffmannii]